MSLLVEDFAWRQDYDLSLVSAQGHKIPQRGVLPPMAAELSKLGAVERKVFRKNILLPFSTLTLKWLCGEEILTSSCLMGRGWLRIETILEETNPFRTVDLIGALRERLFSMVVEVQSATNCVAVWLLCRRHGSQHEPAARKFVLYHLVAAVLAKNVCVHFFRLTSDVLLELLDDDRLNADNENQVLHVIEAWISAHRDSRANELAKLTLAVRSRPLTLPSTHESFVLSSKPPRKSRDIILAVGGWCEGNAVRVVEWFDTEASEWKTSKLRLPYAVAYHGSVFLHGELYVIGGTDGTHSYSAVKKLNQKLQWVEVEPMHEARNYITNSCVACNGKIYVFGGQDPRLRNRTEQSSRLNSGECYNPKINRWSRTANMGFMRSDGAAAALGDKIYISGGFNGRTINSSVEVYDTLTDVFTTVEPLPSPISGHAMVFDGKSLLVIGGFNGVLRLDTVYEKERDSWNLVGTLGLGRSTFSACVYKGSVMLAGGYRESVIGDSEWISSERQAKSVPSLGQPKSAAKLVVAADFRDALESLNNNNILAEK